METKSFRLKEFDDEGVGSAVIATLGVLDRDGDVILPGAFGVQHVAVVPAHDASVVPLGKAVISERGNEAIAEFNLNTNIQGGKEWASHLKFDLAHGEAVQQWSFRYDVIDGATGEFGGEPARFLKSLQVPEVSPVLVGAGINTRTMAAKARDDSANIIKEFVGQTPDTLSVEGLRAAIAKLNGEGFQDEPWVKHRQAIHDALAVFLKAAKVDPPELKSIEEMKAALAGAREFLRFEQIRFEQLRGART